MEEDKYREMERNRSTGANVFTFPVGWQIVERGKDSDKLQEGKHVMLKSRSLQGSLTFMWIQKLSSPKQFRATNGFEVLQGEIDANYAY